MDSYHTRNGFHSSDGDHQKGMMTITMDGGHPRDFGHPNNFKGVSRKIEVHFKAVFK